MKSIKFQNGDIVITSKRLQLIEDKEEKVQRTRTALEIFKGELFYNADVGLDYKQILSIDKKYATSEEKKLAIVEALQQDENINQIGEISITDDEKSRNEVIDLQLTYKDEIESTTIEGVEVG